MIEAVGYKNVDLLMPPKGKLPDPIVADLTAWVKMGLPWPDTAGSSTPGTKKSEFDLPLGGMSTSHCTPNSFSAEDTVVST